MKIVALILAKAQSSRLPAKNFRDFYRGKSLLEIKIQQCIDSGVFSDVYVSSDSKDAEVICERSGVARFLLRDAKYCIDETPWSDALVGILHSLPESDDVHVALCPPTSPMFSRFDDVVDQLRLTTNADSAMTVTKHQHYFLNADCQPLNFQFGVWHSYSQKIKPLYQMNCAMWLAQKSKMILNRYQVGDNPTFFETTAIEGLDIDTIEEFDTASYFYGRSVNGLIS